MWSLITSLLAKWALFKLLLKTLGSMAWLIPVAFILKLIGLPVLIVLAILAAPIFIILAIIGLPIMLVIIAGIVLLVGFFFLLSMGLLLLKIAIPVVLIYWLFKWLFKNGRKSSTDPAVD
jgi:hypothetical protein